MFSNAASFLLIAAALPSALAKIFITAPTATTVFPVGQDVTVQWQDDGSAPLLAQYGVCSLGIYTGNQIQQTLLQQVGTLDVSVNNSITFKINVDIGPSGESVYFMRFTSTSLADSTNPQFPAEAFSAMFAISGSTGTFNSTIQAEISGVSSAAAAAATTAASAATNAGGATTAASSTAAAANKAASSTVSAVKTTTTAKTNTTAQSASQNTSGASPRTVVPALFVAAGAFFAFFF